MVHISVLRKWQLISYLGYSCSKHRLASAHCVGHLKSSREAKTAGRGQMGKISLYPKGGLKKRPIETELMLRLGFL